MIFELIAVLVIMAIIALIVTPLIMNIVKNAKDSANKRSVDAYGKAVELAIATHLLDTGDYPTDLNGLTVEYTRNEVVCNIKTLNEDGSIYLSECSVKGTLVKDSSTEDGWYHYGKSSIVAYQSYNVGDVITYNGMNFYVIEDSDSESDRVTMLKAEPLSVDEVNTYGIGHINIYLDTNDEYYQTVRDVNGYGAIAYYTNPTCYSYNGGFDGCITDYNASEVKYVVDAWSNDKLSIGDLAEDTSGYTTRLLTFEDLTNNLGYIYEEGESYMVLNTVKSPSWVYDSNYDYWTMSSAWGDSTTRVWRVRDMGNVDVNGFVFAYRDGGVVRPVVTLLKSAI